MATRPLPSVTIPTMLEGSLLARLDRLASARETAQIGAALGRHFLHELIAALAAMPPQQLEDSLTRLEIAELLYRRGTPPDAEYTFKHALVQNAAYGSLLRSRRQQLHDLGRSIPRGRYWPAGAHGSLSVLVSHDEAGFGLLGGPGPAESGARASVPNLLRLAERVRFALAFQARGGSLCARSCY
jgi:hypothetical protein